MINSKNRRRGDIPLEPNIIGQIKRKHTVWKRYMETRDGKIYHDYCRIRNQVKALTRHMRKIFEKNLAKEAKRNPKAVWKYIKTKRKTKEGISELNTNPDDTNSPVTKTDQEKPRYWGTSSPVYLHKNLQETYQPFKQNYCSPH